MGVFSFKGKLRPEMQDVIMLLYPAFRVTQFLALWYWLKTKKLPSHPKFRCLEFSHVSYLWVFYIPTGLLVFLFWAKGEPRRDFRKANFFFFNCLSLITFYGLYFDVLLSYFRCTARCCTPVVILPTLWGSPPLAQHCTTPFRELYRRLRTPCLRLPPESLSVPGRPLHLVALLSRGRGCLRPTPPHAPTHPVPAPSWSGGTSNRMRTWAVKASLLPGEMRACMQTPTCFKRGDWAWQVPTEHTQTQGLMVPNMDWVDSIVPPFVPRALMAGPAPPTPSITPLCTGRSPETASCQLWVPKPLLRPLTEWLRYGWLTSTAGLLTACPPTGFQ